MARGFNRGLYGVPAPDTTSENAPERTPEEFTGVFYSKSRKPKNSDPVPTPPQPPEPVLPAAVPSAQQLGGMLNGLIGSVFENNNWWLWAALLIILLNPELRNKLIGKDKT